MAETTSEGTRVYICTTPTSLEDITGLAALTYVEVKGVETLGEIGPQSQDSTFTPLAGPNVKHLKGARDNGITTTTCARLPLDPGQIAMKAAEATKFEYAVKIVMADAADNNDTDTVIYVRGPIMSARNGIGGANDVTKVTFGVANNVYLEDASEAVT